LSDEIISWRVDPYHFWLAPTAWGTSPPLGMVLTGLFINMVSLSADLHSLNAMPLLRLNKFDAAMAVLVVIPINK